MFLKRVTVFSRMFLFLFMEVDSLYLLNEIYLYIYTQNKTDIFLSTNLQFQ